ncbi:Hypothetical Protein FCC1311_008202 [Hondaea fermentalgiana]|uniref:Uncharacterized protein n=1 Tax=Hondaea fermentalgiana TaxID=2315210 RepID=A0A2R5G966_9STRA|nr:Hypothetical Protein FCC1311_008202 [Hondaea fermentalgiana]|eukprot:GBG24601.1 Hypothetical Protein FCC1311_008202 [Hondaea fermentalgiana]
MESPPPHGDELLFDAPTQGDDGYAYAENGEHGEYGQQYEAYPPSQYRGSNDGYSVEPPKFDPRTTNSTSQHYQHQHQQQYQHQHQYQHQQQNQLYQSDRNEASAQHEFRAPSLFVAPPMYEANAKVHGEKMMSKDASIPAEMTPAQTPPPPPTTTMTLSPSSIAPSSGSPPQEEGWVPRWDFQPISEFAQSYERRWDGRNKTKNLRCFPSCGENGLKCAHVRRGYCGAAADFRATARTESSAPHPALCAFATLSPVSEAAVTSRFTSQEGVREADLKAVPGIIPCEIIPDSAGSSISAASVIVRVRGDRSKWNYMWLSSRQLKHVEHTLNVFLFERGDNVLQLAGSATSSPFTLTSGRTVLRRKRLLETDAPGAAYTSSSSNGDSTKSSSSNSSNSSAGDQSPHDSGSEEPVKHSRQKKASRAKLIAGLLTLCRGEQARCIRERRKRAYLRQNDIIHNIATPLFCETLDDRDLVSFLFNDTGELELDIDENIFDESSDANLGEVAAPTSVADTAYEPTLVDMRSSAPSQSTHPPGHAPEINVCTQGDEPAAKGPPGSLNGQARGDIVLDAVAKNRKLAETLDQFFETCVSGPAGESLQAALSTSKRGVLESEFARTLATRLYEAFEETLGRAIEEVLSEHSDELQEFEETDVKTLEAFLLCIPAVNKKRSMLRHFEQVIPDSAFSFFNGAWLRSESSEVMQGYTILSDFGLFSRPFAASMAQSSRFLEFKLRDNVMHVRMGDPSGPWSQQILKEMHLDDQVHNFNPAGSLFWLGAMPNKQGRARISYSPCGRYVTYDTIYMMTSDYTNAVFGGEAEGPESKTSENEQDLPVTYVAMVEAFVVDRANPTHMANKRKLFEFPSRPVTFYFSDVDLWVNEGALVFDIQIDFYRRHTLS